MTTSAFASLGSLIQSKAVAIVITAQSATVLGRANVYRRSKSVQQMLDAYALERLCNGAKLDEVKAEITKVVNSFNNVGTLRFAVKLVDGQFPMTAMGILQRNYNFTLAESRMALCVLQLCVSRYLTAELNEATVEDAA